MQKQKLQEKAFQSLHKHFNHRKKTEDEVNSILPQKKEPFFVFVLFTLNFFRQMVETTTFLVILRKRERKFLSARHLAKRDNLTNMFDSEMSLMIHSRANLILKLTATVSPAKWDHHGSWNNLVNVIKLTQIKQVPSVSP